MRRAKPLWSTVTLRYTSWDGPEPQPGDVLQTSTGRRYEIREVRGKQLLCQVIPADTVVEGRLFWWRWNGRRRK